MTTRYITDAASVDRRAEEEQAHLDSTPPEEQREDPERYRLYRLCPCENCAGTGKEPGLMVGEPGAAHTRQRCSDCRGEGKTLDLVATATDPESVGAALVQLCLEDEFSECPFGLMDRPAGQTGKWLLKPWLPSARNVSDAAKLMRKQQG